MGSGIKTQPNPTRVLGSAPRTQPNPMGFEYKNENPQITHFDPFLHKI
jgi:hypothetical protein